MRTALGDILEAEHHRIFTAADGAAGLKRALEEKPDLILLDIMMPELDGYALCEELRNENGPARARAACDRDHAALEESAADPTTTESGRHKK